MMLARQATPRPKTNQNGHIPAAIGGINAAFPVKSLPETDCYYAYNLITGEGGLRTRPGWQVVASELAGLTSKPRTIMGYRGSAEDGSKDRLFSATPVGIANLGTGAGVTTYTSNNALSFTDPTGFSGLGVSAAATNLEGNDGGRFLYYADEQNGLHIYEETANTWAKAVQGSGTNGAFATAGQLGQDGTATPTLPKADVTKFAFVTIWKRRPWFVERGTSRAWYLPVGNITGALKMFDFGAQFRTGGSLVGLWSWTMDGGSGPDDRLVAISSSGDVVIYQGTDPADASTFGIVGTWSVGAVPRGRRIATNFGGDVAILSFRGLVYLSSVVQGQAGAGAAQFETFKISPLFNRYVQSYRDVPGWSVQFHPAENALLVLIPSNGLDGIKSIFAQGYPQKSWFEWRNLSLYACDAYRGDLYLGAEYGRIGKNTGFVDFYQDPTTISPGDPFIPNMNQPISYGVLTGATDMGRATQKRVELIIPAISSETAVPIFEATAVYGLKTEEAVGGLIESLITPTVGVWGSSKWGEAVWAGSGVATAQPIINAFGVGRDVAVQFRGKATSRTILSGFNVIWSEGGYAL